jgi:hypothetical protein
MVEFILHNTLGAWWARKLGPIKANSESEARSRVTLSEKYGIPSVDWKYLRFIQDADTADWTPLAGMFNGWPNSSALIRLLDPCMGSGHFLVFAIPLLTRLRMEEEELTPKEAISAVLADNIHGLELDERCTQIAAFNVALAAWKLAGHQVLPTLNLACSGLSPAGTEADWVTLAGTSDRLRRGMVRLYNLFSGAPLLGSLINPHVATESLIEASFQEMQPLLSNALASSEGEVSELAVTAQGLAKAAEILASHFTLVVTNVPYLGRLKQVAALRLFCDANYPDAKADLASCFIDRSIRLCEPGGTATAVIPQNVLFLGSYEPFRRRLLTQVEWNSCIRLGAHAFETIGGEVVNVALLTLTNHSPEASHSLAGLNVSTASRPPEKATALGTTTVARTRQASQAENPNAVITFEEGSRGTLLSHYAESFQGACSLDIERFRLRFWELSNILEEWMLHVSSPDGTTPYSGMHYISQSRDEGTPFHSLVLDMKRDGSLGGCWQAGRQAWGRRGIGCAWMGSLPVSIYLGQIFDNSLAAIVPRDQEHVLPIYCFCSSPSYLKEVRKINQKAQVANTTLAKVPFDLAHWQAVAEVRYPNGLPTPHSGDPTQWLFNGHPKSSEQPLHVAVARLLNYEWPLQTREFPGFVKVERDGLESFADAEGIVCLSPLNREQPGAGRLRQILAAALGHFDERTLISSAGPKGSHSTNLEEWLRDEFFEQHAKLFHDCPFIWHLWDGRSDGFHALLNYHRLDHSNLQKLTYTYLGEWIQQQQGDAKAGKSGAAERLGAAKALQDKLAAIIVGEAPLDIFVRWKSLRQQTEGWHPDISDGVRQNIRPFLLAGDVGKRGAGLFRDAPLSSKDKDRGAEPMRPKDDFPWLWCEQVPVTDPEGGAVFTGNRWNSVHLTLARKLRSRT